MQSPFFPPAETVLGYLKTRHEDLDGPRKTLVSLAFLRQLLTTALKSVPFDPDWYLQHNPDIAKAWSAKQIQDLHEHFIHHGYFEGRSAAAPPVDEEWYLKTYKDVADGVRSGRVASGLTHYMEIGIKEGRIPNPEVRQEIERWRQVLTSKG